MKPVVIDEFWTKVEETCRPHGFKSLVRSDPETNRWFANISRQCGNDWQTFPAYAATAREALEASFRAFKEYIANAVH